MNDEQRKIIRISPDGSEAFVELPEGEEFVCDFCSDKPVVMAFGAVSFQTPDILGVSFNSRSDWAACAACAVLVKDEKLNDLSRRSAETWIAKYGAAPGMTIENLQRQLQPLHARFFHARQRARDDAIGTTERNA